MTKLEQLRQLNKAELQQIDELRHEFYLRKLAVIQEPRVEEGLRLNEKGEKDAD
jgi:hypothetical protein